MCKINTHGVGWNQYNMKCRKNDGKLTTHSATE